MAEPFRERCGRLRWRSGLRGRGSHTCARPGAGTAAGAPCARGRGETTAPEGGTAAAGWEAETPRNRDRAIRTDKAGPSAAQEAAAWRSSPHHPCAPAPTPSLAAPPAGLRRLNPRLPDPTGPLERRWVGAGAGPPPPGLRARRRELTVVLSVARAPTRCPTLSRPRPAAPPAPSGKSPRPGEAASVLPRGCGPWGEGEDWGIWCGLWRDGWAECRKQGQHPPPSGARRSQGPGGGDPFRSGLGKRRNRPPADAGAGESQYGCEAHLLAPGQSRGALRGGGPGPSLPRGPFVSPTWGLGGLVVLSQQILFLPYSPFPPPSPPPQSTAAFPPHSGPHSSPPMTRQTTTENAIAP